MIYGIDVSFAQGDSIDWDRVKASGKVEFAYSRVSYGANPADDDGPIFIRNHDECKRISIPFGAYMFWIMGQDGEAQAQHFLEQANGRYGACRPMVDVEEGSGVLGWGDSVDERIRNLAACCSTIEKSLGKPFIYTNLDTWESFFGASDAFSGHELWVASYGVSPGVPRVPTGFKSWTVHQYTSGGIVDGIPGYVDLDIALGLSFILR